MTTAKVTGSAPFDTTGWRLELWGRIGDYARECELGNDGDIKRARLTIEQQLDLRTPGLTLPAPLGWWTDELEKIFAAKEGSPITADMKRAAHMALTVARGGRWDDEKKEWIFSAGGTGAK